MGVFELVSLLQGGRGRSGGASLTWHFSSPAARKSTRTDEDVSHMLAQVVPSQARVHTTRASVPDAGSVTELALYGASCRSSLTRARWRSGVLAGCCCARKAETRHRANKLA